MKGELRALTGLRGVAACYVVLYHFTQYQWSSPLGTLLHHGYLSVDLFFVLSGFVMALNYAGAFLSSPNIRAYRSFLYRRLARVYPLYLVTTLISIGFAHARVSDWKVPGNLTVAFNLLMVNAWGLSESINPPSWSISTEFGAYVLFPLLVVLALKPPGWCVGLQALACLGMLYLIANRTSADLHQLVNGVDTRQGALDVFGPRTLFPLLRCIAGFVLGLISYRIAVRAKLNAVLRQGWFTDATALTILVLLTLKQLDVVEVPLFALLVIGLTKNRGITSWIMASPAVHWLGLISYSIYLVHLLVAALVREPLRSRLDSYGVPHAYTVSAMIAVAITVVVAAASFYYVEDPARKWARRLAELRSPRIEVEPSAP